MSQSSNQDDIITRLYHWCTSFKDQPLIRDTTKLRNTRYDAYVESNLSNPLSFTVFELSDKGELLIDNRQKLLESQAAFFLFVNPRTGWIFSIKNTLSNQKKLLNKESVQNFKIKIID